MILLQEDEESLNALNNFLGGGKRNVLWVSGGDRDPVRICEECPALPLKKRVLYLWRAGDSAVLASPSLRCSTLSSAGQVELDDIATRVAMGDVSCSSTVLDQMLRSTQEVPGMNSRQHL